MVPVLLSLMLKARLSTKTLETPFLILHHSSENLLVNDIPEITELPVLEYAMDQRYLWTA